jgi:class II lanthipeptide synthase
MIKQPSPEHHLTGIAVAASSLWERLAGGYQPDADEPALADERLARWRDKAAGGSEERFTTRLGWLGRSRDQVLPLLGRVRLAGPEPAWLVTLARALSAPRRWDEAGAEAGRHPFGHVLAPFVHVGRALLASALEPRGQVFSPEAEAQLIDDLVHRLSYIAAPCLYVELAGFRSAELGAARPDPDSDRVYRAFTEHLWNGGLDRLFAEYAVLARLLAQAVELWADGAAALANAFAADRGELARQFAAGAPLGAIRRLRCGLSDPHDGQRTVVHVTCDGGVELYYKPRDLGIEAAWYHLLDDLRAHGVDLRSYRVVTRPDHGWVEPASPAPCRDLDEAHRFYHRAGALLCLQYALEASDCFHENIVASDGHPVLVDHETLMHHVIRRRDTLVSAADLADDVVFNSVLRAGFLPSWEPGHDGTCVDISGLGATPGQMTPYRTRRWTHVNSDAMSLDHEPLRIESAAHLPALGGQVLSPIAYTEDLLGGFRDAYDRVLATRRSLCAPGGPIEQLGQQRIRLVFHATRIYGLLLKRLYSPRHMRLGVDRSIELDIISRLYLEAPEKADFIPILTAELAALERLDIPYFSVPANGHDLALPTGEVIEHAFGETGVARVHQRLHGFSAADRDLQQSFIRAAIGMSAQLIEHRDERGLASPAVGSTELLTPAALTAEAARIAERIAERAIFSSRGQATWIAPQLLAQTGRQHLSPMRVDLYSGVGGIALLFSALHRVSGTGRDMARAALASLREFLAAADRPILARRGYGLGAASGFGSFLYVIARAATLLDEPDLLTGVDPVLDLLDAEWLAADREFDVMAGAAGALVGLVAYHRASGSARARNLAERCAEHLLAHQTPTPHGGTAWRAQAGQYLTGMSHGAAGIAMALARLHDLTGDPRLAAAARDALAFEDAVFDSEQDNWPDFRHPTGHPDRPAFMETWCHGAPGIGLARATAPSAMSEPAVERAIDAAVATVRRTGIGSRDGLCCGNTGRIDLLVTVAGRRRDATLMQLAGEQASAMVARARHHGYRFTPGGGQELFDPSFFQGLSGVAYQLLRCAHPDIIPSAIAFE